MKPETKIRGARIYIPVVAVLGFVSVFTSNWMPAITFLLQILLMLMIVRSAKRELEGRPRGRWFG